MTTFDMRWHWGPKFPRHEMGDRKGSLCRVLVRSRRMNSALVEFPDGFRVVTSRNAFRRAARPHQEEEGP